MANMTAALRKALMARPPEEQARIGEKWAAANVLTENWSGTGEAEGRGLPNMISARFAWETLSLDAREILHQMISFKILDGVPREDLQALTGLGETEFVSALSQLEQSIMLIEVRPDAKVRQRLEARGRTASHVLAVPKDFHAMFITIDQEIHGPFGDRSKMQLVDLLATLEPARLQIIETFTVTRQQGPSFSFYTSLATPTSIAGKLVQPNIIEAIWERLDATEQEICRRLCRADGNTEMTQIQVALKLSRVQMAHYINQLANYGLAFDTFSGQEYRLFIGKGTFKVLRTFINELDEMQEQAQQFSTTLETGEAPPIVHDAHGQLLADLAIIVNAVYQTVIEPTQAGYVPKRLANKIFPLLHGNRYAPYDEADYYLDMVFSIAHSLELIRLQESLGQKTRYLPGPKLKEWTRLEGFEQVRRLLELWESASDRSWTDVAGVNFRPDNFGYGYYLESSSSRPGLLGYLADNCQPGQWYALAPFLQTVKAQHPLLLRERSRYATYGGVRNRREVLARWDQVDGEIITGILSSSLHELGLVTSGYQASPALDNDEKMRNPDAFLFTELAAQAMWDKNTARLEGSENGRARTLIVQPNFELLLLQPDYPTLYQLLPFVKVEQIEMVSRLTLTQESVRRGVEAGFGVEHVLKTLRACSQKELPQNVLYTLQDWGRLYKDATISQTILIEVSSETVADEICASSKLRSLELRRLGPRAIAVGGQVSLQVLRTTLEKDGIILHIQGDILNAREFASAVTAGYGKRR